LLTRPEIHQRQLSNGQIMNLGIGFVLTSNLGGKRRKTIQVPLHTHKSVHVLKLPKNKASHSHLTFPILPKWNTVPRPRDYFEYFK